MKWTRHVTQTKMTEAVPGGETSQRLLGKKGLQSQLKRITWSICYLWDIMKIVTFPTQKYNMSMSIWPLSHGHVLIDIYHSSGAHLSGDEEIDVIYQTAHITFTITWLHVCVCVCLLLGSFPHTVCYAECVVRRGALKGFCSSRWLSSVTSSALRQR